MNIQPTGFGLDRLQPHRPTELSSGNGARGAERVSGAADSVELSQTAREINRLTQAVNDLPDVREDRVAELKARIAAGQYQPSAAEIASKLINAF